MKTLLVILALLVPNLALSQISQIDGYVHIAQALNDIKSSYGDTVSVYHKRKTLNKFGQRESVGTTFATVASLQGSEVHETFVTTNTITTLVSTSASDVGKVFTLEGHTIDATGKLTFATQQVTCNGQTEVTLTTSLARASRLYVTPSGVFASPAASAVGVVSVFVGTGSSAGVPTTASATKITLNDGDNQSEKCATTISNDDYWIISEAHYGVGEAGGSAGVVVFQIQYRDIENGGAWRPTGGKATVAVSGTSLDLHFQPHLIIPKNHDFRVVAATDSNTASVYADVRGYLATVVSE